MLQMDVSVHQRIAITARIDQQVAEQLNALARNQGRSVAGEVRRVLTEHVQAGAPKSEAP
jgi:hypothetical protein